MDRVLPQFIILGIDFTIECIKNEWIKYGPFDGLLGFSQGAVMAHIITSLKKNCDSQKYSWLQSLQFGIFVAGFPSRMDPPLIGNKCALKIESVHTKGPIIYFFNGRSPSRHKQSIFI